MLMSEYEKLKICLDYGLILLERWLNPNYVNSVKM